MTKKPCPHLEKELRKVEGGWFSYTDPARKSGQKEETEEDIPPELRPKVKLFSKAERIDHVAESMAPEIDEQAVQNYIQALSNFGLEEHEIVILVEKSLYGKTYREIALEYGFVDQATVWRLFQRAYKKAEMLYLREAGE